MVPSGVAQLIENGHTVLIEKDAGRLSGFADEAYRAVGASIVSNADAVFSASDLIVKSRSPWRKNFLEFDRDKFFSPIYIWLLTRSLLKL